MIHIIRLFVSSGWLNRETSRFCAAQRLLKCELSPTFVQSARFWFAKYGVGRRHPRAGHPPGQ
jgi:hypothetical protein